MEARLDDKIDDAPRIKVRAEPHMPEGPLDMLREKLTGASCFLEYGAGGSSRLAARLAVKMIYSVESDVAFAEAVKKHVRKDIKRHGLKEDCRFRMVVPNIGPTGKWGFPEGKESAIMWPGYPLRVWEFIERDEQTPDLVLIDGRFRLACFFTSLLKCQQGATILFDDYADRGRRYEVVEKYIKPVRVVGRMAEFIRPKTMNLAGVGIELLRSVTKPG